MPQGLQMSEREQPEFAVKSTVAACPQYYRGDTVPLSATMVLTQKPAVSDSDLLRER